MPFSDRFKTLNPIIFFYLGYVRYKGTIAFQ